MGYQLPKVPLKPWFRAGYYLGSGDGSNSNGQHGTFFPILPTPRIYARDPFYNKSNLQDIFVQTILRTSPKRGMTAPLFTIRGDVHSLRLADSNDLWYGGGGAYDNSVFGYNGRPSSGKSSLATLVDLSVDYAPVKSMTVTAYLSYANGGNVISSPSTRAAIPSLAISNSTIATDRNRLPNPNHAKTTADRNKRLVRRYRQP